MTDVGVFTSLWSPEQPDLSRDGRWVAWKAGPASRSGEHGEDAVFVAPADGSAPPRRWTYQVSSWAPAWSPDGAWLAFLSDRADRGTSGLYLLPADGGEAAPLVVPSVCGVDAFAWSPDGTRIAYLACDEPDEEGQRRERERDDAQVYGEGWRFSRLRIVEVATGQISTIVDGDRHVVDPWGSAVAWSPGGDQIAYLVTDTPEEDTRWDAVLYIVDLVSGESRRVADVGNAQSLAWCADGAHLVYVAPQEPHCPVSAYTVYSIAPDGGQPKVIGPGAADRYCGIDVHVVPGASRPLMTLVEGLEASLHWVDPATGTTERVYVSPGDGRVGSAVVGADGAVTLALVESTPAHPLEVVVVRGSERRVISDHGSMLAGLTLGAVEPFAFTAPDGIELDGVLVRPAGAGSGPLPTVVWPHAGPYNRYGLAIDIDAQWIAAGGYAVLMPNYRGGQGHGHQFVVRTRDTDGAEFGDLMAAVDAAVARGISDPGRLAIRGRSYGGYVAAWAITHTNRFHAAIIEAGLTDWAATVLASDIPRGHAANAGGVPWTVDGRAAADRRSPTPHAERVTTPVLVLHGTTDQRAPTAQGTGFARALRACGATVRQVVYPREGHWISETAHQRHALIEIRQWLDRHLKS